MKIAEAFLLLSTFILRRFALGCGDKGSAASPLALPLANKQVGVARARETTASLALLGCFVRTMLD